MNLGLKTGLLGTAAALAIAVTSVPAYAQDDLSSLRQQLETMKERLAKLEADKADKRRVSAAAAVEAGDKPRSWKLPGTNTSMNVGGFVKMQVLWDFSQSGQGTAAGATTEGAGAGVYPVPGSVADNVFNGGNVQFTARRSRFWIQTWTPTDWGELRTYIEADFAGSGSTAGPSTNLLRLRQAFGTLGPVLMGKTQTLFGGLIGQPELLHDGAPMAMGALRIEQIRYSHNFGGGLVLSVALESPCMTSDAAPGGAQAGSSCDWVLTANNGTGIGPANAPGPARWPDVVAALQWNFPNGALYASGMIGQRNIDSGGPSFLNGLQRDDSTIVWGGTLAGRYDFGRVEIGGMGGIGSGIGNKYFDGGATGFVDGVIVANVGSNSTDLRGVLVYGGIGYVQVKVTDTIRVTGAYNYVMHEVLSETTGGTKGSQKAAISPTGATTQAYWAAFGNILWNPVPQVTFGAEYSYQFAYRYNGPDVHAHRLQLAAIYRF